MLPYEGGPLCNRHMRLGPNAFSRGTISRTLVSTDLFMGGFLDGSAVTEGVISIIPGPIHDRIWEEPKWNKYGKEIMTRNEKYTKFRDIYLKKK